MGKITVAMASIAAVLLLLSACNFTGQRDTRLFEQFKGTQALTFNFIKGLPPDEVYAPVEGQKTPFRAAVEIQNQGSQDIKSGYFVLSVEKNYMEISKWETESGTTPVGAGGERLLFSIEGKSQSNPVGGRDLLSVNLVALPLDKQSTQHKSLISLTSCYDYITELSKDVCIDTDIYNLRSDEKPCVASDIGVSGGQGAPVEVTKIEQKMLPSENSVMPQFIITVRNSGSGEVVDKDKIDEACSASPLDYDDVDVIDVEEVKFSRFSTTNGQIECVPAKIKLKSAEGKLRCTLKPGILSSSEAESYTTPLYIKLAYGYTQSLSKEITVKNILAE